MKTQYKSLLLPLNAGGKVFIQDRRGHQKPDWGFFGGKIEEGETPLEGLIRESKEELSIDLEESNVVYLGVNETDWDGTLNIRHFYVYRTDQVDFDVREGVGGKWVSLDEARSCMDAKDRLEEVAALLESASPSLL